MSRRTRGLSSLGSLAGLALAFLCACTSQQQAATPAPSSEVSPPQGKSLAEAEAELAERIRAVVLAQRAKLRACYEEGLARTPSLEGRVVLVLEVGQNGMATHVFEARREGLGEAEVACFARVLKATHFHDGAASSAKIQIPLAFAPGARAP